MDRASAEDVRGPFEKPSRIGSDEKIIAQATSDLAEQVHFRRHLDEIRIECSQGVLSVQGRLPSYYLKQLLQTVLRDVPGVERINNQVSVVSSNGLSNSR